MSNENKDTCAMHETVELSSARVRSDQEAKHLRHILEDLDNTLKSLQEDFRPLKGLREGISKIEESHLWLSFLLRSLRQ